VESEQRVVDCGGSQFEKPNLRGSGDVTRILG